MQKGAENIGVPYLPDRSFPVNGCTQRTSRLSLLRQLQPWLPTLRFFFLSLHGSPIHDAEDHKKI
jgi:hypothetical protein